MTEPTLPALARQIASHFPELGGRAIASSEVDPFEDAASVPTLPMAVVGLITANGSQTTNGGGKVEIVDGIMVQLIFEPVRYTREDGKDLPFWAFYDYETIRDRMLAITHQWRTPRCAGLSFRSMDVSADEFAVYLSFQFTITQQWNTPDELIPDEDRATGFSVHGRVRQAKGVCIPQDCPPAPAPCDAARKENPHGRENWTDEERARHGPITS